MTTQLQRTGQRIVVGTWGCAVITMAASAANAALTYGALGDNRALGLATGVAVDIGLCVALIGDRQLYTHGLSSNWGRALRITTAVMSLVLNVGISLRDGHYFAALLHSFLPVLLIVLCEYGQDVLLQFTALRRKQETAQHPAVAPVPVAGPHPQLHRPLAPPPVPGTRAPIPQPMTNHLQEAAIWTPTRTSTGSPSSTTTAGTSEPESPPSSASNSNAASASSPSTAASVDRSSARTPVPPAPEPPSRVSKPAPPPDDDLVTRVRQLVREGGGQTPGRRTVAKHLGVTEHQARVALELVGAPTGPVLNGSAGKPKTRAGDGGSR